MIGRLRGVGLIVLLACTVAGLAILAYWPGMEAPFYFDDEQNIVYAAPLHWSQVGIEPLRAALTEAHLPARPVANLSFALNHLFSGLRPEAYHWTNLVLHLLTGACLAWLCREYLRALGDEPPGLAARIAIIAAVGLFLLHPLNIQSVTYVVQRMTVLATLFCVASFACYLRARRTRSRALFAGALLLWLLAAGSKEIAFGLPLVVLLYEATFHRRAWAGRAAHASNPPRRVLAIGALAVVALLLTMTATLQISWFEPYPNRDFGGWERMLTQTRVQLFYLGLLLWPSPARLNLDHEFAVSRTLLEPATAFATLGCVLMIAGSLWLARKKPVLGFPLLAYFGLHLIESGPLNIEMVFEHRMYLPLTMLALALCALANTIRGKPAAAMLVAALLISPVLAYLTWERNQAWAEPTHFLRDAAEKSPSKFRPIYNLGTHLGVTGQYAEAEAALTRALTLRPEDSRAHNQLANVLAIEGRTALALEHYRRAVAGDPTNAEALYNLAVMLERRGETAHARELFEAFVRHAPPYLEPQRQDILRRLGSNTGR